MNWKSKKLWASILGVMIPGANAIFGWGLVLEEIAPMVLPLIGYTVGQGIADVNKEAARVKKGW